ncbi:D-alanyl-D-alanine dipeptidase [Kovacikia minuta CCNUW1]|uniref:M15 family metallopeptidase n=1 Tax=Kovacikia minuta TaxID=2931930 RepID=UPI001CCFDC7F|nr:M15 family metallopeptidase [Kovacikia minuta]UBF27683.1 D-alanyl-D-alanine dipeptidase [Kovacikia minuta CCNUW1]
MKPYQQIPIAECGEPLLPIPPDSFSLVLPHPYEALGAPYGDKSPFYVRESVLGGLVQAQKGLHQQFPGWQIQIFDAYRPVSVQQYMVDYTFQVEVQKLGLLPENLTQSQREAILERVYEFWAVPSFDPATPPPHSTGAAVDVTLVDETGQPVNMGSAIDEISPRSYPDHFANWEDSEHHCYHQYRQRLREAMMRAGFQQHPQEWWHFSMGDQMWAWLIRQKNPGEAAIARYGRFEEKG